MSIHSNHLVMALEAAIKELGSNFLGDRAFSFATEADLQGQLLGRLRSNTVFKVGLDTEVIDLAHSEFSAYGASGKRLPRHDIVVWNPELAAEARNKWGYPKTTWTELGEKGLNLLTVEIKQISRLPWNITKQQMFSDDAETHVMMKLHEHGDIRKLMESHSVAGYFLIFWCEDVQEDVHFEKCFQAMDAAFGKLVADTPKLRAYCATRDGLSFSHGFQ